MRNRHGDEYRFEQIDSCTYTIVGDLKWWRYGGQDDQQTIDYSNLGFVDPSGGPFIGIGYLIGDRKVVNISLDGERIIFKVEQDEHI